VRLRAGLAHHVLDSQRVFRAVLEAMSHPGRIVSLPRPVETPPPLNAATAAFCLALLDAETPLWLDALAGRPEVEDYLRFHCGCPIEPEPARSRFAVVVDPGRMPRLEAFDPGSEEFPDRSATLVVEVEALLPGEGKRLTGPGIDGHTRLLASGMPAAFWGDLERNHSIFPRGVDVVLTAGQSIAGLPRTTRVERD
jgi:alpha-D-ribose 1-methylphosphonate 5-triphosphate synthase subunit PhnH